LMGRAAKNSFSRLLVFRRCNVSTSSILESPYLGYRKA
jgi:hypothetical protein